MPSFLALWRGWLYEETYCARGDMENRIKECQLDLFRCQQVGRSGFVDDSPLEQRRFELSVPP
jgi:hypothetical protein